MLAAKLSSCFSLTKVVKDVTVPGGDPRSETKTEISAEEREAAIQVRSSRAWRSEAAD